MNDDGIEKLLNTLSPGGAQLGREAMEALRSGDRIAADQCFAGMLYAVAYPELLVQIDGKRFRNPIPLPDTLTVSQQAAATLLAQIEGFGMHRFAIPVCDDVRRRWLGIDPGGVLERMVDFTDGALTRVPLWRALSLLSVQHDHDRMQAIVDAHCAGINDRLRLLADLILGAYRLRAENCLGWGPIGTQAAPIAQLDGRYLDWAEATAARLVALEVAYPRQAALRKELCWPIMAIFLRSGRPIGSADEDFLQVTPAPDEYATLGEQYLNAIPPTRRAGALRRALDRMHPTYGFRAAFYLVSRYPYPTVVDFLLNTIALSDSPKHRVLERLQTLAAEHPALKEALQVVFTRRTLQ